MAGRQFASLQRLKTIKQKSLSLFHPLCFLYLFVCFTQSLVCFEFVFLNASSHLCFRFFILWEAKNDFPGHLYQLCMQFITLHTSPCPCNLVAVDSIVHGNFHVGGASVSHLAQNVLMNNLCFS